MDHALHRGETYVDSPPHDLFTRLRRKEPVVWQEMDGEPGYWAVLRHADVVHVAKNSDVFSATEGGVVIENLEPAGLEQRLLPPPQHREAGVEVERHLGRLRLRQPRPGPRPEGVDRFRRRHGHRPV